MKSGPPSLSRLILLLSGIFLVVFEALWALDILSPDLLDLVANVGQLAFAFACGTMCFSLARREGKSESLLYVSLALLSWGLGQTYWISFVMIKGHRLPFPSIAEFGFLGFYLLSAPAVMLMNRQGNRASGCRHLNLMSFLLLIVPAICLRADSISTPAKIYGFLYVLSIALLLLNVIEMFRSRQSLVVACGFLLVILTDMLFVLHASFAPDTYDFLLDPLWPLAFSIVTAGLHSASWRQVSSD